MRLKIVWSNIRIRSQAVIIVPFSSGARSHGKSRPNRKGIAAWMEGTRFARVEVNFIEVGNCPTGLEPCSAAAQVPMADASNAR